MFRKQAGALLRLFCCLFGKKHVCFLGASPGDPEVSKPVTAVCPSGCHALPHFPTLALHPFPPLPSSKPGWRPKARITHRESKHTCMQTPSSKQRLEKDCKLLVGRKQQSSLGIKGTGESRMRAQVWRKEVVRSDYHPREHQVEFSRPLLSSTMEISRIQVFPCQVSVYSFRETTMLLSLPPKRSKASLVARTDSHTHHCYHLSSVCHTWVITPLILPQLHNG